MTHGRRTSAFWQEGYDAIAALHTKVAASGLDPALLKLVRIRASQVNGCAFCIDMHSKDARRAGETEQRIYALLGLAGDAVLRRTRASRSPSQRRSRW